jgi:hypothetical protein
LALNEEKNYFCPSQTNKKMIVFSEAADTGRPNASQRDLIKGTEAARLQGCRIFYIPPDFSRCGDAEGALAHVPVLEKPQSAVWLGFIPSPERYTAIFQAAAHRNIHLLNNPEEHLNAQEFHRFYPLIELLTPASVVIQSPDEIEAAAEQLGFPIFVKGTVQSRKARGLKACLAENLDELHQLSGFLWDLEARSRGRVIARRYIPLRHVRMAGQFPQGREYRVFCNRGEVIGWGYYWDEADELALLNPLEKKTVLELACQAADLLGSPFVAVDIGQAEDGKWWVIETGDAQFSGLSQVPRLEMWGKIAAIEIQD